MTDQRSDLDDAHPSDPSQVAAQIPAAIRVVAVHDREAWPHGTLCRNCHAQFPCDFRRWGQRILLQSGWHDEEILTLPERIAATGLSPI